jgi:hypothetical protein
MILTKIFHVEMWANFRCVGASRAAASAAERGERAPAANAANAAKPKTPNGELEYYPKFHLYDAEQYVLRSGQPLDSIYALKARPGGLFGAAPEPVDMFLDDNDDDDDAAMHDAGAPSRGGGGGGPRQLLTLVIRADNRRYTFASPPTEAAAAGGEARELLLPPPFFVSVRAPAWLRQRPGRPSIPPNDTYVYRVGAPVVEPAGGRQALCRLGERHPGRKVGEWQFWVYEKPPLFGDGLWTADQLCQNGPRSSNRGQ